MIGRWNQQPAERLPRPFPPKMPRIAIGTATSKSASAKTIWADLPPISADTGVWLTAAAWRILTPVALEPVKVIQL